MKQLHLSYKVFVWHNNKPETIYSTKNVLISLYSRNTGGVVRNLFRTTHTHHKNTFGHTCVLCIAPKPKIQIFYKKTGNKSCAMSTKMLYFYLCGLESGPMLSCTTSRLYFLPHISIASRFSTIKSLFSK